MLTGKKALILDMNSTFMFGEDRFSDSEDFSLHYFQRGGTRPRDGINRIIRDLYEYLDVRYPDETYQLSFPSLERALQDITDENLDETELKKLVETFTYHELGYIPGDYVTALWRLHAQFTLGAVIDIWSPKSAWLDTFERVGISGLFSSISFSSDHGMVKPSPKPFELVLGELEMSKAEAVVIGDSPRRDLGGARNAGIDCILVGGAEHPDALTSFKNLLELCNTIATELSCIPADQ